jgi:hypothetical protein
MKFEPHESMASMHRRVTASYRGIQVQRAERGSLGRRRQFFAKYIECVGLVRPEGIDIVKEKGYPLTGRSDTIPASPMFKSTG